MKMITRRQFLSAAAAAGAAGTVPGLLLPRSSLADATEPTAIRALTRVIEVNGRAATVFGLQQPDGTHGLTRQTGQRFQVRLQNLTDQATLIHWHGLTPPHPQDGVPDLSQPVLPPGGKYDYDFPLTRAGTNWMHSHHGLQEQRLMAAPLIVQDPADAGKDMQEVVVTTHDFTFREPDDVLAALRIGPGEHGGHGAHGGHGSAMATVHLHDVEYDAFLANDRTLRDPEIVRVERGGRVRLRLINAATTTNFWVDLGDLRGTLIAVDGMAVAPVEGQRFEFAIAQRLDILLALPSADGSWPVLMVREGDDQRTGVVLATATARVSRIAERAPGKLEPIGLELERRLRAADPLAKRDPDRRLTLTLGELPGYGWTLNGAVYGEHTPLEVAAGERVELTFEDHTTMAHPMHLHGHHFQVVAMNGERFAGAMRDTVLVPAGGRVTIAFDASNPGHWPLHCHNLMHMAAGMMSTLHYRA